MCMNMSASVWYIHECRYLQKLEEHMGAPGAVVSGVGTGKQLQSALGAVHALTHWTVSPATRPLPLCMMYHAP